MKKVIRYSKFSLIIYLLSFGTSVYAQSPDEIVGKLMNEQRMFELRGQHEQLQEQLSPMISYFSQAMLAESFNNPESGIIAVDTLLNNENYQAQLGLGNIAYLIYLKSGFLETLFRYKESSEMLESFLDQTKDLPINQDLRTNLKESLRINRIIANFPPTQINRPQKNVEIDYVVKKAGKGLALDVPCEINGKEAQMCLDTGNPKYSVVTENFANKYHIKTIVDSIPMKGVGSGFAKIGIAEDLKIGDVTCHNSLFYIVNKITPIDTISLEAVLGSEVLNLIGEIQLYPAKKKIVFPQSNTLISLSKGNLIMNKRHLFIQLVQNSETILMHFDTGSSLSNMSHLYFADNKDTIEQIALKDSIRLAGYGGVSYQAGYKLPKLDFILNEKYFEMKDIAVYTENIMNQWNERGCLGANFVQKFNKVIVSYKNMFIELEE
ncbi:hypothetical protein DWB61_17440 [Ancylomarina euxinus]|uniref:Peptidase A2 domain-containing protein n=1 Tax=Ancylomarina euxinus TaxID=2283627 RepID=A0A425XWE6_9BACT|nr:retropepsin-like aspartic protease [Ancylomarina euxinus]MCZ4696446.1 retropepsin-like aspartic protease [Ancylomarina euxinus]RRG18971.1 hypothetical protein DWB61_17440 [Ancylomarina euxinus]